MSYVNLILRPIRKTKMGRKKKIFFLLENCIINYPKFSGMSLPPEHLSSRPHDSKAGGRKDLMSCSFTPMAADAGLSWGPPCFFTLASLYHPSLWTSLGFLASWCMTRLRGSIPKEREPDGSCFAFFPGF